MVRQAVISILAGVAAYELVFLLTGRVAMCIAPHARVTTPPGLESPTASAVFISYAATVAVVFIVTCRAAARVRHWSVPLGILAGCSLHATAALVLVACYGWSRYAAFVRPGDTFVMVLQVSAALAVMTALTLSMHGARRLCLRAGSIRELETVPPSVRPQAYRLAYRRAVAKGAMIQGGLWVAIGMVVCYMLASSLATYAQSLRRGYWGRTSYNDHELLWFYLAPLLVPTVLLTVHQLRVRVGPHAREFMVAGA